MSDITSENGTSRDIESIPDSLEIEDGISQAAYDENYLATFSNDSKSSFGHEKNVPPTIDVRGIPENYEDSGINTKTDETRLTQSSDDEDTLCQSAKE